MKLEQRILELRKNENSEWHKPRVGVYHASALHDMINGVIKPKDFFKEKKFDDKTLMIFEIGHMYHEYVQSLFPDAIKEKEIKIAFGDFKIVGRVDLIIKDVPVELKTCSAIPSKPYEAHVYQLQSYLHALDKDFGFITYIEKNPKTFITKDYKIHRDTNLFAKIGEGIFQFHEQLIKFYPKTKVDTPDKASLPETGGK